MPVVFGAAQLEQALDTALERALNGQQGAVAAYVNRQRRRATPAEVVTSLERRYLTTVTAIGAASGGVAALPGVGTAASIASGVAEVVAFVEASAVLVLGLAEVHGIRLDDPQLRRTLVLAVVLGETGAAAIEAAGAGGSRWVELVARGASREKIVPLNSVLFRSFVRRFGARQGVLALGRALPFGIGAGVGAVGNAALGRAAVRAARRAFGPPPASFAPRVIDM